MRRCRPKEEKRVGEFRLLRGMPEGVNFHRFQRHMARLKRRLAGDPVIRKLGMKNRWRRRAATRFAL
jgi:hypothetical protein